MQYSRCIFATRVIRKAFIRTAAYSHNMCNVQIIVTTDLLHTGLSKSERLQIVHFDGK